MEKPITRRKVLLYALFHNHYAGLCKALRKALEHFNMLTSINAYFLPYMFPLFTYENATKFGARDFQSLTWYLRFDHAWWEPGWWIFTGRLRFHIWLLKEYWNDETDMEQLCQEYWDENFKIL
jgi:hypothetical protein